LRTCVALTDPRSRENADIVGAKHVVLPATLAKAETEND
jgi:hypothetical protein